jgi:hypothetical protein
MKKNERLEPLMVIPGVGKSIAADLWNLGIRRVEDLKGKSPEKLYEDSNLLVGTIQDPCLLYVFRCAVYFAETDPSRRKMEKLSWWYWKNKKVGSPAKAKRKAKLFQFLTFL